MSVAAFAERTVRLEDGPFSLEGRRYLRAVYRSRARNLVIRASRQVEKTTFIVNRLLHAAVARPRNKVLLVCPRQEQAALIVRQRLAPALRSSPTLTRLLWNRKGELPLTDMQFDNGSVLNVRSAFRSAGRARGISADELFIDEFQDIAPNELAVLQECLSHSAVGRTVLTGTPNLISNHIEAVFARSTANEWRVPCPACGHQALLDQRVIGDTGLICPQCLSGIDVNQGQWQARNPDSDWGDGYHICHLMVPWVTIADIRQKQADYDAVRFQNEVLGLPTDLGDHLITREQIERCCEPRPMASSLADIPGQFRAALIAGIDWGGSSAAGTVLVIGCLRPNMVFAVYRFDRWRPGSDPHHVCDQVAAICRRFRVQLIAADGGGQGHIYDRLLFKKIGFQLQFWELFYSGSDQQPRPDGALMNWTINRTASIAALFARLKNDQIKFPRAEDCRGFLDEFVNEVAIYDQHMRTVRYDHAPGHPDDALHATNYVHALALRIAHAHH